MTLRTIPPLLAALLLALPAAGQLDELDKSTPQQRADVQTNFMKSRLDLSADQLKQVEALNLSYAEKAEPVIQGGGGRLKEAMALRKLQEAKEGELKQILTPEQLEKYDAAKQELQALMAKKLEAKQGAEPSPAPAP